MAVIEGNIPTPPGDKLDTTKLTQTDGTEVHREVVVQGDPEDFDARAKVTNAAPGASDYGGVVRIASPLATSTPALTASGVVVRPVPGDFSHSVALGNVTGHFPINKFGRSTNVDSGVDTDIWDQANATADDDIWTAPTQARTHQITSSSASDDGDPAGVGARTIRVYGLTDWGTAEVSEDITMNGTTDVPTVNQYVIIHRMKVLTKGATSVNVGLITATADTDGTITAAILAGEGQTQMAIYGIPSTQSIHLVSYYAGVIGGAASASSVTITLKVNPEPDAELLNFLTKHVQGLVTTGNNHLRHPFDPHLVIAGPAIIKIQGNGSANNLDVFAGFDGIVVDN